MPQRAWGVLLLLILIAVAMRLWHAAAFPFEQDELYTRWESRLLLQSTLPPGTAARPLFFALMHPLLRVLPSGELGLRLPALVIGVFGVGATMLLGHRVAGLWGGIVAGMLVALSPWHLHASAMARYWSAVYLLVTLTALQLVGVPRRLSGLPLLALLALIVAGGLTHPTFLMTVAGAALGAYAVGDDGRWRVPLPGWTHLARLWLPSLVLVAGTIYVLSSHSAYHPTDLLGARGRAASLRLVPAMVEWSTPLVTAAGVLGAILLCAGTEPVPRRFGAMSLGAFASTLSALLIASLRTPVWTDYGIGILPFMHVSAAGLFLGLATSRRGMLAGTALALVFAAAMLPTTASALIDGTRFDYRPAFAAIHREAPHRVALVRPLILQREYAPELTAMELQSNRPFLDSVLTSGDSVWAVVSRQRYGLVSDPDGVLGSWLGAHCRLDGEWQRHRLDYREHVVLLYACGRPESGRGAHP